MANTQPAVRSKLDDEIELLRDQLKVREADIAAMLESGMTVEQFFGLITRACIANPDLLRADRLSLIQSALDCANDGLKPDGREGAFVVFRTKVNENGKWIEIDKAQWMPMIRGIIKKILNVSTVKSVKAEPIYTKDHFRRWADDDGEHMEFQPARGDRGTIESYFAAIWMKDSVVFVEEMTPSDIAKVKAVSKATNDKSPWFVWEEEMSKKTVIKRLSKRVPLSAEVERIMSRDDQMFLESLRNVTPSEEGERPKGVTNRLNALADNRGAGNMEIITPGKEKVPAGQSTQGQRQNENRQADKPAEKPVPMDAQGAYQRGIEDKEAGKASMAMPKQYRSDDDLMDAWQRGYHGKPFGNEDNDGEQE